MREAEINSIWIKTSAFELLADRLSITYCVRPLKSSPRHPRNRRRILDNLILKNKKLEHKNIWKIVGWILWASFINTNHMCVCILYLIFEQQVALQRIWLHQYFLELKKKLIYELLTAVNCLWWFFKNKSCWKYK